MACIKVGIFLEDVSRKYYHYLVLISIDLAKKYLFLNQGYIEKLFSTSFFSYSTFQIKL